MKIKYVDLCAGIGGFHAGFSELGWKCLFSNDIDADAAKIHSLAFGICEQSDVRKLLPSSIETPDVLVAGFPCQPFSSSGTRDGFEHSSGDVFESIRRQIKFHRPKVVVLENVQGLFSNQNGYSFASILSALTNLDYIVEWTVLNTSWFGIPQNRPRLFIIARAMKSALNLVKPENNYENHSVFSPMFKYFSISDLAYEKLDLRGLLADRNPDTKTKKTLSANPFARTGLAVRNCLINVHHSQPKPRIVDNKLGNIVAPNFEHNQAIRSARYWAHSGITKTYVKADAISHCLGTSIGAPPIFCIPNRYLKTSIQKSALMEFSNWQRQEASHFLFRLVPSRAVLLFGDYTREISNAVALGAMGNTVKYRLVGNMVSPQIVEYVGRLVETALLKDQPILRGSRKGQSPIQVQL